MSIRQERLNIPTPGRCSLTDCIIMHTADPDNETRRCFLCEHGSDNKRNKRCWECLDTIHLDNFIPDRWVKDEPWYKWMMEHISNN